MKFVQTLAKLFDVYNHDIALEYEKEDKEDFAACIRYDSDYRRIHIKIYPCFFTHDSTSQASFLLHEFCHLFTIPFSDAIKDLHSGEAHHTWSDMKKLNERQTTAIEQVVSYFITGNAPKTLEAYKDFIKKSPLKRKS